MRAAAAQIEILDYGGGERYEGQVDQGGDWHGQGVYSGADGFRYEGEQRKGFFHGHGTMTNPDGTVDSGQWKDDRFLG